MSAAVQTPLSSAGTNSKMEEKKEEEEEGEEEEEEKEEEDSVVAVHDMDELDEQLFPPPPSTSSPQLQAATSPTFSSLPSSPLASTTSTTSTTASPAPSPERKRTDSASTSTSTTTTTTRPAKEERVIVGVRVRPLSKKQKEKGRVDAWRTNRETKTLNAVAEAHEEDGKKRQLISNRPLSYAYDYLWGGDADSDADSDAYSHTESAATAPLTQVVTNQKIHEEVCESLIQAAFDGYNSTIFAYGQTATGKTHTITGTHDDPGLLPRSVTSIFQAIRSSEERDYLVRCSYIEVYNEQVCVLLFFILHTYLFFFSFRYVN